MATSFCPRRVLLTGGAGFIGSHLVDQLLATFPDVRVVVLDLLTPAANLKNLDAARQTGRVRVVHGDIRGLYLLLELMRTERFDTVLHLAAETNVDLSFESNARAFLDTNAVGTQTVLEAARIYNAECAQAGRAGIVRLVNTLTDELVGSSVEHHHGDEAACDPTNPYSASKACAKMLGLAYWRSYKLPVLHISPNNVYGPRQKEKVLWKFCHRLMRGLPLEIHGGGQQRRSFLHVEDAARAFIAVLQHGETGLNYNVESADEYTIAELARRVLDEFQDEVKHAETMVTHTRDRLFNDQRYWVKATRLKALGWAQQVRFDRGLPETVAWYRAHRHYWTEAEVLQHLHAHPDVRVGSPG